MNFASLHRGRLRACALATAVVGAVMIAPRPATAQRTSVWLDASGTRSRPPGTGPSSASSYGIVGARVRTEGRASSFELGASGARGVERGSGGWLNGRVLHDASRVAGRFDFGVQTEASGLTYLSPVDIGSGSTLSQTQATATVRPQFGLSIGMVRVGVEGAVGTGFWRTTVATPVTGGGPFPPLPGPGSETRNVREDGAISLVGGAVTALRVFGPASVQVRAGSYDATNQVAKGRYTGIDATIGVRAGIADLSLGARHWQLPGSVAETGGHASVGIPLGSSAYLQGVASRSIADPLNGASGSVGLTVGISMRLGSAAARPAPAVAGAVANRGRRVTFTLKHTGARSIAVAGDFSGWEPRSMTRGEGDRWTIDVVLEPGVYHYAFVVNGETWTVPDHATGIVDDGFGRKNATLVVAPLNGRSGS